MSLEALLLEETSVSGEQLERAQRIAARLKTPAPVSDVLVALGQLARSENDRVTRLYRAQLTLAEILYETGALNDEGLKSYFRCRTESPAASERDILVGRGLVSEEQFLRALSDRHNIPYLEPEAAVLDDKLLGRVSLPYLMRHRVLPFRIVDDMLTVVMNDPFDHAVTAELGRIYGLPIRPCCAPGEMIDAVLRKVQSRREGALEAEEAGANIKYREIRAQDDGEIGADVIRIIDHIFCRAIQLGASDVHIEPREKEVCVRVRIDGVMQRLTELPAEFSQRIAARVKVLCGADLAERRLHQDGRIFVRVSDRDIDMRVSTYASVYGETVVVRILDRARGLVPLQGLGFESGILRVVEDVALREPSGVVLVTGPTGSGKTTTLYSFVDSLLDGKLKVITCEDPVEYVLDGATQCSVNSKVGPSFPDSLRAMMRQDPDVIVVGEIRDKITAVMAVEAALTGHKVFSSFHTEDSVSAVLRLLEMGVEPFLVASTVSCIIAQRLLRKLCPHCAKPATPSKRDLRYLGLTPEVLEGAATGAGAGCDRCGGTGYKGRMGVHEVLVPDDDFRDAILGRVPSKELRNMAKRLPAFLTLGEDAVLKAVHFKTSLSEMADRVPRDLTVRRLSVLKEIAMRRGS